MSLLAGLTKEVKATETDSLGFQNMSSDVRVVGIKMAYLDKTAKGTVAVHMELQVLVDGSVVPPKTQNLRHTEYISYAGGDFEKDGKTMRGLAVVNGICQLTNGKNLFDMELETKSIEVYEAGTKVLREREVVIDLIGSKLSAGILLTTRNKQAKNNNTGAYTDTAEAVTRNEIDKFFHEDTLQTSDEFLTKKPAVFVEGWKTKYVTGEAFSFYKQVADTGVVQGMPSTAGAVPAPTAPALFA